MSEGALKPHTVPMNTKLIRSVEGARLKYSQHLEEVKETEKKKEIDSELIQLENERDGLQSQCNDLEKTINSWKQICRFFQKIREDKSDAILDWRKCIE